jgi:hypothetical protein
VSGIVREPFVGVLEKGECLGIGPAALGLFGGEDGVIDGLLVLAAAAEVIGEKFDHLVYVPRA